MSKVFQLPIRGTITGAFVASLALVIGLRSTFLRSSETGLLEQNLNFMSSRQGLVEGILIPLAISVLTGLLVFLFGKIQILLKEYKFARQIALFFLIGGYLGIVSASILGIDIFAY